MQQETLTQKKKFESNSRVTYKLVLFDIVGGKILARVVEESRDYFQVTNPGILLITNPTADGGKTFQTNARIQGWIPWTPHYRIYKTALRGLAIVEDDWLQVLYAQYAELVQNGVYETKVYELAINPK